MVDANGVGGRYDSFHAQVVPEVHLANSGSRIAYRPPGFFDARGPIVAHRQRRHRLEPLVAFPN
jgi:hypothetical protein